jgi:hypothetical protein
MLVRKQHGRAIWLGNNMEEQYDIKIDLMK